jgi:hypothetical protein
VISSTHGQDLALVDQADEHLSFTGSTLAEYTGLLSPQPIAVRRDLSEARHTWIVENGVRLLDVVGKSAPASQPILWPSQLHRE